MVSSSLLDLPSGIACAQLQEAHYTWLTWKLSEFKYAKNLLPDLAYMHTYGNSCMKIS